MTLLLALLLAAETYTYWVEPCTPELARAAGCQPADAELAGWALDAWQGASQGRLSFQKTAEERTARLRFYWAAGNRQLYGEARPIVVQGKPGAEIYVRPDLAHLGPEIESAGRRDPLYRHTIVYLTCLHESGHGLGLSHTAAYDDIMYFFGYGGDVVEYFARYRRKLASRDDIRKQSGISPADQARLTSRRTGKE